MNRTATALLQRLRTDAGRKTIGELMREREAAACEIERMMEELDRANPKFASAPRSRPASPTQTAPRAKDRMDLRSRALLRLKEVCEIIGTSRSTVYKGINEGTFPRSVQIGEKAVRWRSADIAAWLEARGAE
jgi:prophage regulatory protein